MKKLKALLLLSSLLCTAALGQVSQIKIVSVQVKNTLPAKIDDWGNIPAAMILTAQKSPTVQIKELKLVLQIKTNGSIVCGNSVATATTINAFDVKTFGTSELLGLLGNCQVLKEGSYQLCAQFFNVDRVAVSTEACKEFKVEGNKTENYTPPSNIAPANNQQIKESEAKAPITFRWTPIVPKPQQAVTYRLKVWQLMQGQNATQAMRSNQPIVTKDVDNITQASISKLYTGPCKPPYLCDYVWNVEALTKDAVQGSGKGFGSSEPTTFGVSSPCTPEYEFIKDNVYCDQNGKVRIIGHVKITPKSTITINSVKVTQVKENNFSGADIPTNITSFPILAAVSGNNHLIDFVINSPMCDKTAYIGYTINYTCSTTGISVDLPCGDTIKNLPCCKCNLCDQVQWQTPELIKYDTSSFRGTNNVMTLYGNINFGPQKIIKLSAEIVDFYWYTEGDCKKCNSNDYYFGNLVSGSATGLTASSVADESGVPLTSSHQIDFISPTLSGVTLNTPIALNISLPPQTQLSCCTDCFRFCIRYTATFMENGVCKTCTIVKCYESKRKHRKNGLQQWPQPNQCGDIIFPPHGGGGVLIETPKQ
jgi:hypothetical protein